MPDPTLERYVALAQAVHALLREPEPDSLVAPPQVRETIAKCLERLGPYVCAMPGAQAAGTEDSGELRALQEEFASTQR